MGLRDDIQTAISEEMVDSLADTVEAFTAARVTTSGTLDPATGTYTETTETWAGNWIRDEFSVVEIDTQHIQLTDIKRIILQSGTDWIPEPDDTVGNYYVFDVQQDGAQATWTIQLREAS